MALTELVETDEWVPRDTFGARLALVRQRNGWNVKEAADACGLNDQSWRNWEEPESKGPRDYAGVCAKIAEQAGCELRWLMAGGPLIHWNTDSAGQRDHLSAVEDCPGQLELGYMETPDLELVR